MGKKYHYPSGKEGKDPVTQFSELYLRMYTHTHVRMRAHSCEFNCVTVKTKRCSRKMH